MAFDDISVTAGAAGLPPVAAFSGTPTSGTWPLAVQFTDASTNAPTSWSWTFGDGGTSTAQNPNYTYNAAGTYTVTLTASNAYGSDAETKTNYITVTDPVGGGDWVEITYDDFEGGFGNYTDGGGDCALYVGGTYSHQGSNSIQIRDNSGVSSSFYHTGSYNVTGYVELEVDFWFVAVSMDNTSEDFWLQYFNGSSWQTIETWARGIDFDNGVFYHKTVTIPDTYNYPTNAKLRFMCDASGNRDYVYIDEVKWSGLTAGGADEGLALNDKVVPTVFAAPQNYPNPFNPVTTISFDLPTATHVTVDVFDIRGSRVATLVNRHYQAGPQSVTWNAKGVASGVYFYRVQAGENTALHKMTLLK
jgi:PKD repeat protein